MDNSTPTDTYLEIKAEGPSHFVSTKSIVKRTYYYRISRIILFCFFLLIEIGMVVPIFLFDLPGIELWAKIFFPSLVFFILIFLGLLPYGLKVIVDSTNGKVTFKGRSIIPLCCHRKGYPNFTCYLEEIKSFSHSCITKTHKRKGKKHTSYSYYLYVYFIGRRDETLIEIDKCCCCSPDLGKIAQSLSNWIVPNYNS